MQLPERRGFRLLTAVLICFILVTSGLLSVMNAQLASDEGRTRLRERTETIARALDSDEISQLSGTATDEDLPIYQELKRRLSDLKGVNTDARSIYLAGLRQGSEVFFFVDSEAPESEYYSPAGEAYPEATPEFKGMFSSTASLVEGPIPDSFGTWISGLAPILDFRTGKIVAVVGIDIDAATHNQSIAFAAAVPFALGMFFTLVLAIYEWMRRRDQELLRMRSELVSIASHELRSPIAGIRWATESLLKRATAATRPTVQAIYDSIMHLQNGTEEILQLIKVTNVGQDKLTLAPTDLTELVSGICSTQRLAAQQKGVQLDLDKSWPKPFTLNVDGARLKRAIHNVVSNAIKYTKDRTTVTLHYERVGNEHRIVVSDQGIGIPKAEQQKVFSGFYRASNAKASGIQGTGLGLYLTKTILEQHGGRVECISEEGKGTNFILVLPAPKSNDASA